MALYKYFPPERIDDVFGNFKLRFTQPAVYNDPFELRPVPANKITEEEFSNILQILTDHHDGPPKVVNRLKGITYVEFLADPTKILELILKLFSSGSLVLSLTEDPLDLLMWAHYAGQHQGFVIEFDAAADFFTTEEYCPQKITYTKIRPGVSLPRPDPNILYFTKSDHWQYEKEWRLIRHLPNGIKPEQFTARDSHGFPIYLFDFPTEIIKGAVLGCRMTPENQIKIQGLVQKNMPHVKLYNAGLDNKEFKLTLLDSK